MKWRNKKLRPRRYGVNNWRKEKKRNNSENWSKLQVVHLIFIMFDWIIHRNWYGNVQSTLFFPVHVIIRWIFQFWILFICSVSYVSIFSFSLHLIWFVVHFALFFFHFIEWRGKIKLFRVLFTLVFGIFFCRRRRSLLQMRKKNNNL